MYKSLDISNFRGISNLKIPRFGKINLITGHNNAGKTTILDALCILSSPNNPNVIVQINNIRNLLMIDEGTWSVNFNNLDSHHPIVLSSELIAPQESRIVSIKPHRQVRGQALPNALLEAMPPQQVKDNAPLSEQTISGVDVEFKITSKPGTKVETYHASIYSNANIQLSLPNPSGVPVPVPGLATHAAGNYREKLKALLLTPSTIYGNMAQRFGKLKIEKRTDTIIRTLRHIEPKLTDISLGMHGYLYGDIGLQRLIPINTMGDGFLRILAILLAISECQDGVLLIDEIENGFHHSSQRILWDSISESAKEFRTQIIATSHSMECAEAFNESSKSTSEPDDSYLLFRIEHNDNAFSAISYDRPALTTAIESNWEVR